MLFGQIIFVRNIFMSYTHGMIIGSRVWSREMKYRGWRIYLISRALANNRHKSIKAKPKTLKSFCETIFYHDLLDHFRMWTKLESIWTSLLMHSFQTWKRVEMVLRGFHGVILFSMKWDLARSWNRALVTL